MVLRRNNRKYLFWGGGVLLLILIAVTVIVLVKKNNNADMGYNERDETEVIIEDKTEEKNETVSDPLPKKEEVKQYDGDNPNVTDELTGVISYMSVSGDNLIVRVNIDQYLSNGNCRLSLSRGEDAIYEESVAIEASVSTSTCAGFSVPVSKLLDGKLVIKVVLESGEKRGIIIGETTI